MKKTELLAPAKDKQTAITAITSGADAVYIGAVKFGARQAVGNSLEDIKEVVDFAHKFYVKVHVTINTILTDEELSQAKDLIQKLYEIGVDAIIVQDMGILELAIRDELPPIPIHASTQCNNRTLEKARFFDNLGLSRVILARELSLDAIKEICENTTCEIETFVHGALCVSYSGQCYLSSYIGGRSANRGECAQPCRKKYSLVDSDGKFIAKDKHLLSLKDFNATKHLEKLVKAGVKSFKIEGRLKDENYVKNVVAAYRSELDKYSTKTSSGKVFLDFTPDVRKSFNRGFTSYFLNGRERCFNFESPKSQGEKLGKVTKVGPNWFELDTKIDIYPLNIYPQDGLCFGDNGCLVNKVENKRIYPNRMDGITVGTVIFRNFDAKFDKQLNNSKIKRRIGVNFEFKDGILTATDEDQNSVSLRIEGEIPNNPEKMKENFITQLEKTGESDFYTQEVQIQTELPFLPLSNINALRREILENLMEERLKNYKREIQPPIKHVEYYEKELDYRANIYNETAQEFWGKVLNKVATPSARNDVTSAFEQHKKSGTEYTCKSSSIGKCELMRTKHCLKYAFDMCKTPRKLFLIDEKGTKYPLHFDCKNCEMVILHPKSN